MGDSALQNVTVLLAHGMKMQTADAFQLGFLKVGSTNSQTGISCAGVIDIRCYFGILGINTDAAFNVPAVGYRLVYHGAEALPLVKAVEDNVTAYLCYLFKVIGAIGRGEDVYFLSRHFLVSQLCFIQSAGSCAVKIFCH